MNTAIEVPSDKFFTRGCSGAMRVRNDKELSLGEVAAMLEQRFRFEPLDEEALKKGRSVSIGWVNIWDAESFCVSHTLSSAGADILITGLRRDEYTVQRDIRRSAVNREIEYAKKMKGVTRLSRPERNAIADDTLACLRAEAKPSTNYCYIVIAKSDEGFSLWSSQPSMIWRKRVADMIGVTLDSGIRWDSLGEEASGDKILRVLFEDAVDSELGSADLRSCPDEAIESVGRFTWRQDSEVKFAGLNDKSLGPVRFSGEYSLEAANEFAKRSSVKGRVVEVMGFSINGSYGREARFRLDSDAGFGSVSLSCPLSPDKVEHFMLRWEYWQWIRAAVKSLCIDAESRILKGPMGDWAIRREGGS